MYVEIKDVDCPIISIGRLLHYIHVVKTGTWNRVIKTSYIGSRPF